MLDYRDMATFVSPSQRCYFTPILWQANPQAEAEASDDWVLVREKFAAARSGRFHELDDMLEIYPRLTCGCAQIAALMIIGDAGRDRLLQSISNYIVDEIMDVETVGDLCTSLGLWGRLSAVAPLLTVLERFYELGAVQGLPADLTIMLEPAFGVAVDVPNDDDVEEWSRYRTAVEELHQKRVRELGGSNEYALFGERFSVRRVAERLLSMLGREPYELMMRPFLRQRFEACTGIDCSDFYVNRDSQPLTIAARLEEWLASDAPDRFIPGERYFFGHHIPRS